jgi:hypothetical protein
MAVTLARFARPLAANLSGISAWQKIKQSDLSMETQHSHSRRHISCKHRLAIRSLTEASPRIRCPWLSIRRDRRWACPPRRCSLHPRHLSYSSEYSSLSGCRRAKTDAARRVTCRSSAARRRLHTSRSRDDATTKRPGEPAGPTGRPTGGSLQTPGSIDVATFSLATSVAHDNGHEGVGSQTDAR